MSFRQASVSNKSRRDLECSMEAMVFFDSSLDDATMSVPNAEWSLRTQTAAGGTTSDKSEAEEVASFSAEAVVESRADSAAQGPEEDT